MRRRRFLSLLAGFAALPGAGHAAAWQGVALGADVSVTLTGPRAETERALAEIPAALEQIEALFSLHRPCSALARLNRSGRLSPAPPLFRRLMAEASRAHALTGGIFDPTVQPLWQALAQGGDAQAARALIGWERVGMQGAGVSLAPGQQLTFNGIAQGFATDLIRARLRRHGFTHALVDIGEQAALGGPFRLGLMDPAFGYLGQRSLHGGAVASSSPGALPLGPEWHILDPAGRAPLWSTVAVEAPSATLADALSTAAVFLPRPALSALKARAGLSRITLVDAAGNLSTL